MITEQSIIGAFIWFGLTLVAAGIASQFMPDRWYRKLDKPVWTPPNWVFGPVWTLLYLLMATAAWLIWSKHGWNDGGRALSLFLVQLVLNAAWMWLFYGRRRMDLAFYEIIVLWTAILATTTAFWRLESLAGLLMIPCLAWISFAVLLNGSIWSLNPKKAPALPDLLESVSK
jgi:translocator protein